MKFNFVIAALLGVTQATRFAEMSNQDKLYEYVQTGTQDVLEHKDYFNGWKPWMEDFPGTVNNNGNFKQPYTRNIPVNFVGDAADDLPVVDKYTQNVIKNVAIEGVDKGSSGKT